MCAEYHHHQQTANFPSDDEKTQLGGERYPSILCQRSFSILLEVLKIYELLSQRVKCVAVLRSFEVKQSCRRLGQ